VGAPLEWPALPPGETFSGTDDSRARVKLWDSLVAFGQDKRLASEVTDSTEPLDPAFVDRTVPVLQARGQYRPSLQILYRLLKDQGQVLTKDRALLLYPLAFEAQVADRAAAEALDVDLFYGLIREESTFDPSAKSWVGAQGLTQLMPATAAETAKGLRMKTYDLALPADNLKIGARYLSTMIRSQGRIYLALMAYNAGGGRIKPWKEAMGKLPEEIFVEAAPLAETRGYVKKILTSAVMTGVLHHGRTLDEMVKLIYPGFAP
jgi:soluble lytic murein transglycosylase